MSVVVQKSAVSHEIINSWCEAFDKIPDTEGQVGDGSKEGTATNKQARSCKVKGIMFAERRRLYQSICDSILPLVDYYQSVFDVDIYRRLEIQQTTYNEGDHYVYHTDVGYEKKSALQRKISLSLMLSAGNEFTGGNLVINKKDIVLERGDLVLFRPTMIHCVQPVTSGVRKTLVMWVLGPQWR